MGENASIATKDQALELPDLARYFCERSSQPMVAVEGSTHSVCYANAAFLRLAGIAKADQAKLLDRPFARSLPEGETSACMSLFDRVSRTGIPESLLEQKQGKSTSVYWSYAVWPILGSDGRPAGLMVQVTDSTETAVFRQQAAAINEALLLSGIRQQELAEKTETLNADLKAAAKSKDQFMAVLGHELRNPLNPVLTIASVLRDDPRLDADTREQLEVIRRNAELAARLIDDLLDVTRMKRGKLELDRRPIDLRTIIRRAMDDCRSLMGARELKTSVDLGPVPEWISGDAGRLQQVLWNLLTNAIKFTPKGGSVSVRCRRDTDGHVIVEVSDSGEGIDPELLPRLFNAFEQGSRKTTRQFGGLGLGLTISKAIAEMHGGTLSAHSEGKGRGATIAIRLPTLAAEGMLSTSSKGGETHPSRAAVRPIRILLVEDHIDTAKIMCRVLSAKGHEVQIATDVATALQLAVQQPFDLLLSDLGLPDGSGLDLMRKLRARGLVLPGIALSGYGQDSDVKASRAAGFVEHLVKPVSLPKLAEAIAKAAGQGTAAA